ncbi:MAG TPA: endolytic transglycosylase MltG [Thermoanaerobaculia bacterium]|nr:endolytic transglycosylase MltG [Thermoanaerobaculia bacterium]
MFAIVFLIAGGWFFWRAMTSPYKGYNESTKDIEVKKGQRTAVILRHLQEAGLIRDAFFPLIYLKVARYGESLKAGVYEFSGPLSAAQVLDRVIRGDVILKNVTVREGLDRFAIGELMAEEGFGRAEEWRRLTADPELIRDIDPEARSLEGYLFPDTYKLTPHETPKTIVRTMIQNFRKHFGSELAFITTGLNMHQTVILASIVETEAHLPEERPLVASVYLNRYHRHMLLGADPTVIYALKLARRWDGNIRKPDLQIDSPYNTYRFPGFPPGPIANPGVAALHAAAAPAKTELLYFVSKNDGSHAFSTNLAEHNRNVEIYQRQYFRNLRSQGR